MMPQLSSQPGYQHMAQPAASVSPPVPNGVAFHQRHATPQPNPTSRPSSRAAVRRASSNLVPQSQAHTSQPPPNQNGYAYGPNAFAQQSNNGLPMQPAMGQQPPYSHFPQQPIPLPKATQAIMQEHRRQSMPPTFSQERQPPPPPAPAPELSPPQMQRPIESQQVSEHKRASTKSRSIFTPVDESRSMLAQHWGMGSTTAEPASRSEPVVKMETHKKSHSMDAVSGPRSNLASGPSPPPPRQAKPPVHYPRPNSLPALTDIPPPPRSNGEQLGAATGAKRPRLKVQIPDEQSEAGSGTAESSPHDSNGTTGGARSAKGFRDSSHSSGVVLPPPSPSASALLSAGAQGPPNPFARPNPPSSTAPSNGIETPMSALPSRFISEQLLPSPVAWLDWNFARNAGDANMLPSPLNYQNPAVNAGSSLASRQGEEAAEGGAAAAATTIVTAAAVATVTATTAAGGAGGGKRKTPEAGSREGAGPDPVKRVKT